MKRIGQLGDCTAELHFSQLRGARPVFIDIRPDTLNMDEAQLESLITPATRAIIVVHYAGGMCGFVAGDG